MKIIIYYILIFNNYYSQKKKISLNKPYVIKIPKLLKKQILYIKNFHFIEDGECSYYHDSFNNKITASGDVFLNEKWTCAHKFLPLPSIILVVFLHQNKRKAIKILINDRGPYIKGRILDVSKNVADKMGFVNKGIINIKIFFLPLDTINLLKTGVYTPTNEIFETEEINEIFKINNIKYKYNSKNKTIL
jgi:rare lipoprotein A